MDAQYPFATRDDIWRVLDELKELHLTQYEQGERIARLERRRDEDARLKSVWGAPLSPFPAPLGGPVPTEPTLHSPSEPFKGFDQGHHTVTSSAMGAFDSEDEPRRGASRANSVRFDESAIHGYYGQVNRSSTELPIRTGSGLGSHPLTERSLSHRSDGRQSSSGLSLHSTRTNSLRLDTSSRMMESSLGSPLSPPPGLFMLGPAPCIIRCWLTAEYSNDSLLYAAVCSGSSVSSLGVGLLRKLSLEDQVTHDSDGRSLIRLAVYLPEASVHHSSSSAGSPTPQLPSVTIRFLVRDSDPADESIQIIIGGDVLRPHNADILFSQDKIIMIDDDRNRVSVPIVRPEKDWVFKFLHTTPDRSHPEYPQKSLHNGLSPVGVIGGPPRAAPKSVSAPVSTRGSAGEADDMEKPGSSDEGGKPVNQDPVAVPAPSLPDTSSSKSEAAVAWKSWRREPKLESSDANKAKPRPMTVLKPAKSATRVSSGAAAAAASSATAATSHPDLGEAVVRATSEGPIKSPGANPVGGALAFPWLSRGSQAK